MLKKYNGKTLVESVAIFGSEVFTMNKYYRDKLAFYKWTTYVEATGNQN